MTRLKVYSRQLHLIKVGPGLCYYVRGIAFNVAAIVLAVIGVWLAIYIMIIVSAVIKSALDKRQAIH
jgi:hypothetical protein